MMPSDDVSPDRTDTTPPAEEQAPRTQEEFDEDEPRNTRPPAIPDRYTPLELVDGAIVIYDRKESNAWIESSHAIPLGDAEWRGRGEYNPAPYQITDYDRVYA